MSAVRLADSKNNLPQGITNKKITTKTFKNSIEKVIIAKLLQHRKHIDYSPTVNPLWVLYCSMPTFTLIRGKNCWNCNIYQMFKLGGSSIQHLRWSVWHARMDPWCRHCSALCQIWQCSINTVTPMGSKNGKFDEIGFFAISRGPSTQSLDQSRWDIARKSILHYMLTCKISSRSVILPLRCKKPILQCFQLQHPVVAPPCSAERTEFECRTTNHPLSNGT